MKPNKTILERFKIAQVFLKYLKTQTQALTPNQYERTLDIVDGWGEIDAKRWVQLEDHMKQIWIIDGEWSQYHSSIAHQKGWMLVQRRGLWEIATVNTDKFNTDDAARRHVLEAEADPKNTEHMLAKIAVNAIVVGSIRGW